ncbi:MAG: hypothetical protein Q9165_008377 [Trypethelium subeluteriae]
MTTVAVALETLCTAPSDEIRRYVVLVRQTINRLHSVITDRDDDSNSKRLLEVREKLQKKYATIQQVLEEEAKDVVGKPQFMHDDLRITDLPNDSRMESHQQKIRTLLSQRSLATEYSSWLSLQMNPRSMASQRSGRVAQFVQAEKKFVDKEKAKRGIYHGLKLLEAERKFGAEGISVLLAFVRESFRKMKGDISELVELLQETPSIDLAQRSSPWLQGCQECYEEQRRQHLQHKTAFNGTFIATASSRSIGDHNSDINATYSNESQAPLQRISNGEEARDNMFASSIQYSRIPSSQRSIATMSSGISQADVGPSTWASVARPRCAVAGASADDELVLQFNRNDLQGFFPDCSRVSHSPPPPQILLIPENLFRNIKVYFENSCRNMIFDDHGALITQNGTELRYDLCNDFDSYCFTATMLMGKGLHIESRRALSRASALVEQILRAEHPRTLSCFLEVFIHLLQTGLPEVTSILLDYIKKMSAAVIREGHPWGQIVRLLGELDPGSLDQAMAQIWKSITDIFDSELGAFSRLAVCVRLDYIKRVVTNYLDEERLLREVLAQLGVIPRLSTPRVMLNLAHNLNKQGRHDEAEEMALEVLWLHQEYEMYARSIVERIESLKIVSRSQFVQGQTLAAEQTMRQAIRMIVDQWGIQHPWVPEFMNVLEGWLRGWGRQEEANILQEEIEDLMGRDEIDEQLEGVQGSPC